MARKIQEVRKKSRKIEKRRAKAATKPPKQVSELLPLEGLQSMRGSLIALVPFSSLGLD
jgi:hypothetical protein